MLLKPVINFNDARDMADYLVHTSIAVEFDFVQIFVRALPSAVVVVKVTIFSTQLLHIVIVRPSINLW